MFFQAIRKLPTEERKQLLPALWRLIWVGVLLRFGIQKSARWLGGSPEASSAPLALEKWRVRAQVLRRLSSRLPTIECLQRAMTLRWWMRSQGLPAQLIIGARTSQGNLRSHAWVEVSGQRFDGSDSEKLTFEEVQRI